MGYKGSRDTVLASVIADIETNFKNLEATK
jgi:hypothetical protein